MSAAENLARWREDWETDSPQETFEAMPALLAFAEAVLALHVDDGRDFCRSCDYRWPCPTVRLAEQHLAGAR